MFAKTIRTAVTLSLVIGAVLVAAGSTEAATAGARVQAAAAAPQATDSTTSPNDMGWQ